MATLPWLLWRLFGGDEGARQGMVVPFAVVWWVVREVLAVARGGVDRVGVAVEFGRVHDDGGFWRFLKNDIYFIDP